MSASIFRCPHCKNEHLVTYPDRWAGQQRQTAYCPSWGWGVTLTIDCDTNTCTPSAPPAGTSPTPASAGQLSMLEATT